VKWEILKWASCTFNVSGIKKINGTISKTNCTVFFINQLREKIGVMFEILKQLLVDALKFYASVRLDIRRSTQIKDDSVLGNRTKVKVVKQSTAFKIAEFDIMYGEGISNRGDIRSCR
jgi:recombination protein RecA